MSFLAMTLQTLRRASSIRQANSASVSIGGPVGCGLPPLDETAS